MHLRRIRCASKPWCVGRQQWVVATVALVLLFGSGCRTEDDARAAAKQMLTTSSTLSAYYGALDHVVAATQDAYQAQYALDGVPAQDLSETREQLRLRSELATVVGNLASLFEKITKTTAAKDAAAAASSLNDEVYALKGIAGNDVEAQAVTAAVKAIVGLIVAHKEVEAAKQMAPLCHTLSVFFESERRLYDSLNEAYLVTARSVALKMVATDQVDTGAVFASALEPFGMRPAISSTETRKAMEPYLSAQIRTGYTEKLKASQRATEAMSASLKEMDARVDLLAHDRPMSLRNEPFSLAAVKGWVAEITSK